MTKASGTQASKKLLDQEFSERSWAIMAALFGSGISYMLFQGLQQEISPSNIRLAGLYIFAATLPFQAVYFIIHAYALRYSEALDEEKWQTLGALAAICRNMGYLSVIGFSLILFNLDSGLGVAFVLAAVLCVVMVRVLWHLDPEQFLRRNGS